MGRIESPVMEMLFPMISSFAHIRRWRGNGRRIEKHPSYFNTFGKELFLTKVLITRVNIRPPNDTHQTDR